MLQTFKRKVPKTAPELFKQSNQDWVDECRSAAKVLLRRQPSVTIEDVLRICPRPKYVKPNVTGSVFIHPDFKSIGVKRATRPVSHGHYIKVWVRND